MKRRIRHIHARNGEWVSVHRDQYSVGGGGDWIRPVLKVVGSVALVLLAIDIISELMPYIIVCFIGWCVLRAFIASQTK